MSVLSSIVLAVLGVIVFFSLGVYAAVRFVHFLNRLPSPRQPSDPPSEPAESRERD
jgi:hypothetical protein